MPFDFQWEKFVSSDGLFLVWYKIAGILLLFLAARLALRFIVRRVVLLIRNKENLTKTALEGKIQTLTSLFFSLGNVLVAVLIFIMLLGILGVDIRPILAGAGIAGFAIGFGTQSLIKDIVAGLSIIMENQFNVGDRVKIGDFEGKVISMSVRSTVLRDSEGNRIYLPNGSITHVVNIKKRTVADE